MHSPLQPDWRTCCELAGRMARSVLLMLPRCALCLHCTPINSFRRAFRACSFYCVNSYGLGAIFFSRPSVTTSARYFGALVGAELVVVAVAGAVIRRFFPAYQGCTGGRHGQARDRHRFGSSTASFVSGPSCPGQTRVRRPCPR